ncbi:uncharacterized protein DS421_9g265780 [Arachis hypogaea]|nr:uncharacterized protein DS421_9g265780 [Arachis hypogaea]
MLPQLERRAFGVSTLGVHALLLLFLQQFAEHAVLILLFFLQLLHSLLQLGDRCF